MGWWRGAVCRRHRLVQGIAYFDNDAESRLQPVLRIHAVLVQIARGGSSKKQSDQEKLVSICAPALVLLRSDVDPGHDVLETQSCLCRLKLSASSHTQISWLLFA